MQNLRETLLTALEKCWEGEDPLADLELAIRLLEGKPKGVDHDKQKCTIATGPTQRAEAGLL